MSIWNLSHRRSTRAAHPTRRPVPGLLARIAAGLAVLVTAVVGLPAAPASAATAPTVVTITFDNQWADQMVAAQSLHSHGMPGTFYIISGWIGLPGFLSLADLHTISSWGSEIGGKTVSNANLTTTDDAEAAREVCLGRKVLLDNGFAVSSFAYPFAVFDPADETTVKNCGFNSARAVGDLVDPPGVPGGCTAPNCPYAETLPPANPYAIRTPADGETSTTLAQLQEYVTNASSNGGGLLAFSFHHICDQGSAGCDPVFSVSPALFDAFLTWLQTQSANGVVVKTMQQALGGAVKPAVATSFPAPPAIGANALVNPNLTTADPYDATKPLCWNGTGFGTNTAAFTWSKTGGQGGGQETVQVSGYANGDAKAVVNFDLGRCAPTTVTGHSYRLSTYYTSTAPVYFTVYARSATGTWSYLTQSPPFPATATRTQIAWLTPAVPATMTGISFGLTIAANGTLATSGYGLADVGVGPPAPGAIGVNVLKNPQLTAGGLFASTPTCWSRSTSGLNVPLFSWRATGGQTGGQETILMGLHLSGDAKLVQTMDNGNCAPSVTPGYRYQAGVYYKSSIPVHLVVYTRNAFGSWTSWTQSEALPASSSWRLGTFTTSLVPSSVNGMSIGVSLAGNGSLVTSNYSLVNTGVFS